MNKQKAKSVVEKKNVLILTVTAEIFVVYHYQQPTSVQNCPVWHWCSTSHTQVAFKQGWNGIWVKNPLGTVYRKKNLCSQISKSLPVGNPIPNRKIRTKTKQQKQNVYSFLTSEIFPTWSPFTCVHQQLKIHSCQISFQNSYKCRTVSCWGNYTHYFMMINYNKLPP